MANRKTRAMRRAEYLRQKNAMETQAKEALNQRTQATPDTEDTGHNVPQGGVNQQIQLILLTSIQVVPYYNSGGAWVRV